MSTTISYDVDGVKAVEHDLLGMEGRLMEPRPVLEAFVDVLQQMMAERFASEGEGDWAPLAASTIERKGSSVVGRETDAMMEALTTAGAEGALREFFGDELIFGVNLTSEDGVPYPAIFNDGRGADQPARPLFDTEGMDLRPFTKAIQAYIVGVDRSEFGVGSFGMGATTPFGV
jgi:hypothetical protein